MKRVANALVLATISLTAIFAGVVLMGRSGESADGVTIVIHHSQFVPGRLTVPAGVPVTFTLRNDDPIEHEWIVGTEDVHARHRTGTEPYHDEIPTEVTIPAFSSRTTVLTFEEPGDYSFICHLPGHEAYGMRGTLRVVGK
jgi:uncharacterized cupredoxin-like copper-binding protein